MVIGALRSAINDHGPIDKHGTGSAAKRVIAQALAFMDETQARLPAPLTRDACDVCGDPLAAHPRLYCADKIVAQLQAALSAERAAREEWEAIARTNFADQQAANEENDVLTMRLSDAEQETATAMADYLAAEKEAEVERAARLQAEQERDALRKLAEATCEVHASETRRHGRSTMYRTHGSRSWFDSPESAVGEYVRAALRAPTEAPICQPTPNPSQVDSSAERTP